MSSTAALGGGKSSGRNMEAAGSLSGSPANSSTSSSRSSSSASTGVGERPLIRSRSPILVKYNYYDCNGFRREQTLTEPAMARGVTSGANTNIQRQLSPAFRETLDQIVRNSQICLQQEGGLKEGTGSGNNSRHGNENNNYIDNNNITTTTTTNASNEQQHWLSSSPTTVSPDIPQSPTTSSSPLARLGRFDWSLYEQRCVRCNKTVYQMDKVGPLKEFTFYHQNCFKCRQCGLKLTLKSYLNNQQSSDDLEVYCHRHCPKTGPGKLDNQSVGIRAALNAPKVFWSGLGEGPASTGSGHGELNASALQIRHAVQQTRLLAAGRTREPTLPLEKDLNGRQVTASALSGPLPEHQVEAGHRKRVAELISGRLQFLEPRQKMLEMRHRQEEDALFKVFENKWRQEERQVTEQIRLEWHAELDKLLASYKQRLSSISAAPTTTTPTTTNNNQQHLLKGQTRARESQQTGSDLIELERLNLEKTMTIKLDRKKETLKRKLKEFERQATAELVEKQSGEMLALISMKLEEYKQQQMLKLGADLEQFEAIESLADQLGSSLHLSAVPGDLSRAPRQHRDNLQPQPATKTSGKRPPNANRRQPPPPMPATIGKLDIYGGGPPDELFREVDRMAINVAREDQQTFTDLVHHLTRNCLTDVQKARAIFRWITVKNLNTMHFDASIEPDTPLGLLRGIKNGSESYHVLFKRLCSYAGLHCVVIKGYSKSAGYQPGLKFEGSRFKNSWNAVYVAGAWRFVQCNWGARHLVSVAVMQDSNKNKSSRQSAVEQRDVRLAAGGCATGVKESGGRRAARQLAANSSSSSASGSPPNSFPSSPVSPASAANNQDSLRYEYDDHYFLTEPDEFIYEFFPLSSEWQLLRGCPRPISLDEFERLPFVRSLFFKFGLYFPQANLRSVLQADQTGAATIKIGMPSHMVPSLIFHYNLKYFNSELDHFEGVSLKRFVMQSAESGELTTSGSSSQTRSTLAANVVSFRVHLPQSGAYILDIFANSTTPSQYITGEPMKFKSVCKFKIVAQQLKSVMVPLPDCASGEFGPIKATRLFGLIPISHETALISVNHERRHLEVQFRMTRPLADFVGSLHRNGLDERQLAKYVQIQVEGDIVLAKVRFPEDGQYGLDIYTRDLATPTSRAQSSSGGPSKRQLLTHCCKYLINVRAASKHCDNPVPTCGAAGE